MRILIVGAGGIGGYFGGRLVEKGKDVTFLVRQNRQQQLQKNGLIIRSVHGDLTVQPKTITTKDTVTPFDVILFSTKSYHLDQAIEDIQPFTDEQTVILPLLNGIAHIPVLKEALGDEKIIGGLCFISTTLNDEGEIVQTSPFHQLIIGEFDQRQTERIQQISAVFTGINVKFTLSDHIERDMWHKYLYITVVAGMTTLMRAPVGPIRESAGGLDFMRRLFKETAEVMHKHGAPIIDEVIDQHMLSIETSPYDYKSSMLRDMENGALTEGEHLHGYLLHLAKKYQIETPLLEIVYQNLKVYETWQTKLASNNAKNN